MFHYENFKLVEFWWTFFFRGIHRSLSSFARKPRVGHDRRPRGVNECPKLDKGRAGRKKFPPATFPGDVDGW